MTTSPPSQPHGSKPTAAGASRRDRLRPLELLGLSAVVAAFIAVIVFISTRALEPTAIFAGLTFIVTLMMFAMFALTASPRADEQLDIDGQNLSAKNSAPDPDAADSGADPRGH